MAYYFPEGSKFYFSKTFAAAKAISAMALGKVKPSQAAKHPTQPARISPKAMPTWLLAGPGKNWHSATRSAYCASVSHWRRTTNAVRK